MSPGVSPRPGPYGRAVSITFHPREPRRRAGAAELRDLEPVQVAGVAPGADDLEERLGPGAVDAGAEAGVVAELALVVVVARRAGLEEVAGEQRRPLHLRLPV